MFRKTVGQLDRIERENQDLPDLERDDVFVRSLTGFSLLGELIPTQGIVDEEGRSFHLEIVRELRV
jgi:hypothetical protein